MYTLFTVKGTEYKLRLTTKNIVQLEKLIGCNPLMVFGAKGDRVPTLTEMVNILYCSLLTYNHGIGLNKTYEIFDDYLESNTLTEFVPVIIEIYKASGIIAKDKVTEEEKNV